MPHCNDPIHLQKNLKIREAFAKRFPGQTLNEGVSLLPVNYYNFRISGMKNKWVVGLGCETAGAYSNEYNLIGGKSETKCFLCDITREVKEEIKKDVRNLHNCPFIFINRTVVFLYEVVGWSRAPINEAIRKDNQNPSLPHCMKEMSEVEWFTIDGKQLEGRSYPLSSYSQLLFKQLNKFNPGYFDRVFRKQ